MPLNVRFGLVFPACRALVQFCEVQFIVLENCNAKTLLTMKARVDGVFVTASNLSKVSLLDQLFHLFNGFDLE